MGILLNAMIGAGMLAAPARVYGLVDGWSFAVLATSAIILIPLILCFADLGSRFSETGGPYLYARAVLPGWTAFAVGWLLWISQALAIATLVNLLVSYLAGFFPGVAEGPARAVVIVAIGAILTIIVLSGIRQAAGASNLLVILKAIFVVGFLLAGIAFISPTRLAIDAPPPAPVTFAQAILIYLFAYAGFERGAVLAGEAREPQRDVPAALFAGVALATLAYAAVLVVCAGVLDDPGATDRPLAEVGRQLFGPAGQVAVSAGAIAVILGTILVVIVSMPRMLLALAEQGQLPAWLSAVHPRWRTPHRAIMVSAVLAFGAALGSDLFGSLTFSTAARVLAYILCCIALLRLAGRDDLPPRFKLPARRSVAVLTAVLFGAVLAFGASKELVPLAVVLAGGFVLLAVTGRRRAPAPAPRSSP